MNKCKKDLTNLLEQHTTQAYGNRIRFSTGIIAYHYLPFLCILSYTLQRKVPPSAKILAL